MADATAKTTATGPRGVTDDAFLGGRLHLWQWAAGYRAGVDAVLLAAVAAGLDATAAGSGNCANLSTLDLGAGVGTAGLCLATMRPTARVTLLEREPALTELAGQNVTRNGLGARVCVIEADLLAPAGMLTGLGVTADGFGCVIANPPYHVEGAGTAAGSDLKARANAMPEGGLNLWLRVMARVCAPGGHAVLIHKAEALSAVLAAMEGRFGGPSVLPVHARAGEAAIRVIVAGQKGSRAPLRLNPPFILHGADNGFTPGAQRVLADGQPIGTDPTGARECAGRLTA